MEAQQVLTKIQANVPPGQKIEPSEFIVTSGVVTSNATTNITRPNDARELDTQTLTELIVNKIFEEILTQGKSSGAAANIDTLKNTLSALITDLNTLIGHCATLAGLIPAGAGVATGTAISVLSTNMASLNSTLVPITTETSQVLT